jgi:ATP-dependent Clp protease, protease subunit
MKFWNFKNIAATETEPESTELRIEGDIVSDDDVWIYQWLDMPCASPNVFRDELKQYAGKNITVWIDSYGGDVFAAAGIYNALMEHKGKITVKIDGKAMSAASVIAMAGGEIQMSPVGILMIHNPLTGAQGYASDLRKTADVLDEVKESIMNAYQLKTGKSRNKISAMMDDETYMSAKTAIKEGFADSMLYAEQPDTPQETMNFAFGRNAVLNSTNESIKRLFVISKPELPKENIALAKAKLALQLTL